MRVARLLRPGFQGARLRARRVLRTWSNSAACFVDDCLFFRPDADKIEVEELIDQLAKKGLTLTKEDASKDAFASLGIDVGKQGDGCVLSQRNLVKRTPAATGLAERNPRGAPCVADALGAISGQAVAWMPASPTSGTLRRTRIQRASKAELGTS